jgi:hypothetical protein
MIDRTMNVMVIHKFALRLGCCADGPSSEQRPADGVVTDTRLSQYAPNLERFIKEWFRGRA